MMLPKNNPIDAERAARIERLEAWLIQTRASMPRLAHLPAFSKSSEAPSEALAEPGVSDETPTDYLPALSSPTAVVSPAPVAPDQRSADAVLANISPAVVSTSEVSQADVSQADASPANASPADASPTDVTLASAAAPRPSLDRFTLASALLGDSSAEPITPDELRPSGPKLGVAKPVFGQTDLPTWMQGTVVIIAPHYDDEVLGCGGLIGRLEGKARVQIVFVTDGSGGPVPLSPRQGKPDPHLSAIRRMESTAALRMLGVPEENLHFLNLPEKHLHRQLPALRTAFFALLGRLQPDVVFVPFRYDRHPQHLRVRDEAVRALHSLRSPAQLLEYFIYFRWPLLGNSDVRSLLHERYLLRLDVAATLERKRAALACFASQVTRFYAWQDRPALPKAFLDDFCQPSEIFLHAPAAASLGAIFKRYRWLLRLAAQFDTAHEPFKPMQDRVLARVKDLSTAPTWSADPGTTQPHRPG